MSSRKLLSVFQKTALYMKRFISMGVPCFCYSPDRLSQLYHEKVQEYETKSSGGKMVDPSAEILEELESELLRVAKKYGFENDDKVAKFPKFNFEEPVIDQIMEDMTNEELLK